MPRTILLLGLGLLSCVALVAGASAAVAGKAPAGADTSLYPDLRTVVPQHLNLVNEHQREVLRFSNGIANTGGGPWALRPDPPVADATATITAVQEIRDSGAYYRCGEQPKRSEERRVGKECRS